MRLRTRKRKDELIKTTELSIVLVCHFLKEVDHHRYVVVDLILILRAKNEIHYQQIYLLIRFFFEFTRVK